MSLVWLENGFSSLPKPSLGPWAQNFHIEETSASEKELPLPAKAEVALSPDAQEDERDARRVSSQEALEAPLVLVDAGHGGHDGGAVANGSIEKDLTLAIAKRLRAQLEADGLRVVMVRDRDEFLELEERAALTAKHKANAFVSVHINTEGAGTTAQGIETYFAGTPSLSAMRKSGLKTTDSGSSEQFANVVQRSVCAATNAEDRGARNRDYIVIAQAVCPAVLVECGFLTHSAEAGRLKDAAHQEKLARGIATGVKIFLQGRPTKSVVVAEK